MAHAAGALCLLGAFTPTEVLAARREREYIEDLPRRHRWPQAPAALKSVYPDTVFCPTGGVTVDNMGAYFAAGASIVGIGSNLCQQSRLRRARHRRAGQADHPDPRGRPCLISISSPGRTPGRTQPDPRRRAAIPAGLRRRHLQRRHRRRPPGRALHYLTRVGGDSFGAQLLELWKAEGVDTSGVEVDPDAHTGLYFVQHGPQRPFLQLPAARFRRQPH